VDYAINSYFWLMVASNWKIIAAFGGLLLIVLLIVSGQWVRYPWSGVSAWEAIPASSTLLIKTNPGAIKRAALDHHWPEVPGIIPIRHVRAIDSLFALLDLYGLSEEETIAMGGWNLGISEPHWILAVDVKSISGNAVKLLETGLSGFSSQQLAHGKAYRFNIEEQTYAVSAMKNVIVIATANLAMEAAQNQWRNYSTRINRDKAFRKLNRIHQDGSKTVLMFQSEYAAGYLGPLVKPLHLNNIRTLESLGWMSMEFSETEGRVSPATGYWQPIDAPDFLKHHSGISAGNWNFTTHIPADAALLIAAGHQEDTWPLAENTVTSAFWKQHMEPWIGNGAVYALLEPLQEPIQPYRFMVIEIGSEQQFDATMGVHLLALSEEQKFTHREHSIYLLDEQDLSGPVFGAALNDIFKPYVAKREGVVIFANSLQWMREWLDALDNGENLAAAGYAEDLLRDYHYHFWANPKQLSFFKDFYARNPEAMFWQDWEATMALMPATGFSARYYRKGFEIQYGHIGSDTLQATQTEPRRQVTGQLWQTQADRKIEKGPLKVKSIAGSVIIMAQDADHRIYSYHTDGTMHWSRSLDGPLLSTPVLTASGHLLFNTGQRVYLVRPEDGANVDQSPYTLPVSTDVGLVYNSQRRDDSYYIFGSNGNVYGFQADGLPLSRMRRKDAGHVQVQPVSFVSNGTFHIAMVDKNNRLHCFDETGKDRFSPIQLEDDFSPYLGVDIHSLTQRILMCGKDGRAQVTNLEGRQFRLNLAVEGTGNRHFLFVDLWGDTRKDYLVASNSHLALYAYEGTDFKRVWMHRAPQTIQSVHPVAREGSKYPAIAVQLANNKLWLLDESGQPMLQDLLESDQPPVIYERDILINRNGQLVSLRLR